MNSDFKSRLKSYAETVETALDEFLPEKENYQQTIYKAMRYSLLGGGKRLRGVLTLAVCMMCGGNADDAMPFAAAVEMVHAYSLIHDDLPAMDNDDLRRGKPTSHKVFGEAMAILAGDGLLGLAFETVIKNAPNDARTLRALEVLAENAGPGGMLGGQVVDIESENTVISEEKLRYLHEHKTGALIKAACLMGAIIGGGDDETLNRIEKYAEKIGLAFQITDDILDVCGNTEIIGKQVGSDEKGGKSTFVTLFGLCGAKTEAQNLIREAKALVSDENEYGDFLRNLADYILDREF